MSVNQKTILNIIKKEEEKTITFSLLYDRLKEFKPGLKKKRVRALLSKMKKKSRINYLDGGLKITLLRKKKKERKTERTSPIKDFDIIVKKYELQPEFSKEIIVHSLSLSNSKVELTDDRTDFTAQNVITIDGEDAKDFDDAVYLEKNDKGYVLYVHIADVSHYVVERTKIDSEAFSRGNSYYLVDKVIPMLPQSLSNGICSLKPNLKRYVLSAKMVFDKDAKLVEREFYSGVIISKRRCTYNEVESVINSSYEDTLPELKPFYNMLLDMKEFAMKLREKRMKQGALDLETKELYITVDKNSAPLNIEIKKRLVAYQIIEEFMLIANVVVSEFLSSKGDTIFRVHETPDPDKVSTLNRIIGRYGLNIKKTEGVEPKDMQKILDAVKDKDEKQVIHLEVLRTMKQAFYTTENKGHFGLAFDNYTHFTSPIRRYPDLVIHRLLKIRLGIKVKAKKCLDKSYLEKAAEHSSKTERIAMEAERDIVKRKSTHFMADKIGNEYDGIISGVAPFGFFVEIEPYGIEGLCGLRDLLDHYEYDEKENVLINQRTKATLYLGMKVRVKVTNVNVRKSFIDLELLNEKAYKNKSNN